MRASQPYLLVAANYEYSVKVRSLTVTRGLLSEEAGNTALPRAAE